MIKGKVMVIGSGPGSLDLLTAQAVKAIKESDLVIGYRLYVDLIAPLVDRKKQEVVVSAMGGEIARCSLAVEEALKGKNVALISGGDPGIYGMAGLLLQVAQKEVEKPEIVIIPGITAAAAAAAVLGAPLMHDYAVISLSDLLTPWAVIEKRLRLAAEADFVIAIYNPRSHGREDLLARARVVILDQRSNDVAVGIVRSAGRDGERAWATTLQELPRYEEEVDMSTMVIIGNSNTYLEAGKMITPRGYEL